MRSGNRSKLVVIDDPYVDNPVDLEKVKEWYGKLET